MRVLVNDEAILIFSSFFLFSLFFLVAIPGRGSEVEVAVEVTVTVTVRGDKQSQRSRSLVGGLAAAGAGRPTNERTNERSPQSGRWGLVWGTSGSYVGT